MACGRRRTFWAVRAAPHNSYKYDSIKLFCFLPFFFIDVAYHLKITCLSPVTLSLFFSLPKINLSIIVVGVSKSILLVLIFHFNSFFLLKFYLFLI